MKMQHYTLSYDQKRKELVLKPHSVWWRRLLGQSELGKRETTKHQEITFNAPDTAFTDFDWLQGVVHSVINNYGETRCQQVEQGAYATSYIPTGGSLVTRCADVISQTGFESKSFKRNSCATYIDAKGNRKFAKEGEKRIDFSKGYGELLLEPQRTNCWLNSDYDIS